MIVYLPIQEDLRRNMDLTSSIFMQGVSGD